MSRWAPRTGTLDGSGLRVGIVAARFNEEISRELASGATGALAAIGVADGDIRVLWVPGAFEIPVVLDRLARTGEVDLLVAIGCVVRGDTPHFDHVAGPCAAGVASVSREHGIAVGFGVLTVDTWEQAAERAGGRLGNKGAEAALAAVETAQVLRSL
jgi:6,7-dimethyl-8-ribityllumazine synthase